MTLRVGFLGAGFIAGLHALQVADSAVPAQVTSVFDPDLERATRFSEATGARVAPNPEAVVGDVDVVFICTWTSEHAPMAALAAGAGKAVFLEKPVATDLATVRSIVDVMDRSGVPNAVGLILRSSPALLAMRYLVTHRDSGRLMNVVFRDDQYIPIQGLYDSTWRADRTKAGSGVLLEHSIHDLDALEWLFGPIASISGHSSHFHELDGIEDSVSVLARFVEGHTATLSSVWHDVLSRPSQRRMEVFSERAYTVLEGDFVGPVRWTHQVPGPTDPPQGSVEGQEMMPWLIRRGIKIISAEERFLNAVASGSQDGGPTVREALRAHVLVDAVYRSASSGGIPIDVTPLPG